MLYATTRSKVATYTAQRALKEERAPDGGFYIPTRFPYYDRDSLLALLKEPSTEIVARILNEFFRTDISGMDVEFALGKHFFGIRDISHRIFIGELWRNLYGRFDTICHRLTQRVSLEAGTHQAGTWMRISCRIALCFAIFGELYRREQAAWFEVLDVAVLTGDFEGAFAVYAARKMGLPVGEIICCCNENSGIWDLINRGQMKLNAKIVPTMTPKCDTVVPQALELLIRDKLEWDDVEEFLQQQKKGATYYLSPEEFRHFRYGFTASVVGDKRVQLAIPNLYNTNGYILCPYSALVYAGLMDYRSHPGPRRAALMLSEFDPRENLDTVVRALAISDRELDDWRAGE